MGHVGRYRSATRILVWTTIVLLLGAYATVRAGHAHEQLVMLPASSGTLPLSRYAAMKDADFLIPAVDLTTVDPKFLRQQVTLPTDIADEPGTIVVDPQNRFLYLVMENGTALRYGVGVGREGFAWSGTARVHHAGKWPKWFPPAQMIERDPKLAKFAAGMPGSLTNPLGARALYLFQGPRDTLYRIHGTNEPSSIGKALSSGCIRLFNQDIIDLYDRVADGTKVIVLPASEAGGIY